MMLSCILMLHRVADRCIHRLPSNENMKVSPDFLSSYIKLAKAAGFTFMSLDEIVDCKTKKKFNKYLCITLDDGYVDNTTNALDVFKCYGVPFAVYIATSFPEMTAHLWWYELENILLTHDKLEIEGHKFECANLAAKDQLFLQLRRKLLDTPYANFESKYYQMFSPYLNKTCLTETFALTWPQIEALDKESLCTIGGHTHRHISLRTLSLKKAEEDILKGNMLLEQHLQRRIKHFSYPFGTPAEADQREFNLAVKLKLHSAATTRYGFLTPHTSVYALPRIMLTENSILSNVSHKNYYLWRIKNALKRTLKML